MINYYSIFEIDNFSSLEEVKKKYKELVKKYHPDKCKKQNLKKEYEKKIIEINKAYEILGNKISKNKYDSEFKLSMIDSDNDCSSEYSEDSIKNENEFKNTLEEINNTISKYTQLSKNLNDYKFKQNIKTTTIELTLENVYFGCKKNIIIIKTKKKDNFMIDIPMNVDDGEILSITNNEIYYSFKIKYLNHEIFTKKDNDLYTTLTLSLNDALKGFKRKIKHLNGEEIIITHNKLNKSNDTYILKGYGMKINDHTFGDLIINFIIQF